MDRKASKGRVVIGLLLVIVLSACRSEMEQLRESDPDTAAMVEFLCSSFDYPASLATQDSSNALQNESECQEHYAQANDGEPEIIPVPSAPG